MLSQAGREVLIKAVIQAIPTYTMSCFKLPKGLVRELKSLIQKFLWGYSSDSRKVHWVCWEKLCEVKEVGGMGFKEIEKFNDALLAKQVWRMINNPGSLCFLVFKARFFPNCSILEVNDSIASSYAWKSIIGARDVIRKGMVRRIGDGNSVRVKEDKWLPQRDSRSIISPLPTILLETRVSSLIEANRREWKTEVIQELFLLSEASVIMGIPLSLRSTEDQIIWAYTPSGTYSTSSAHKLLTVRNVHGSSNREPQKRFWKGLLGAPSAS